MAPKLKAYFPKLSICILADDLYTTEPFFELCELYKWSFLVVFKDTQLKTVWKQVEEQQLDNKNQSQTQEQLPKDIIRDKSFQWVNGLIHQGHNLNWVEGNIEDQKTINHQT